MVRPTDPVAAGFTTRESGGTIGKLLKRHVLDALHRRIDAQERATNAKLALVAPPKRDAMRWRFDGIAIARHQAFFFDGLARFFCP